jgi:ferric-dicitrate binding protein FerR (iron transport regulator)
MTLITQESQHQRAQRIRALVAVWFARLHGSNRSGAIEEGFRRWLSEDPDHATQFKIAVGVWNDVAQCERKSPRRGIERPVLSALAAGYSCEELAAASNLPESAIEKRIACDLLSLMERG